MSTNNSVTIPITGTILDDSTLSSLIRYKPKLKPEELMPQLKKNQIQALSLFSGGGGLDLGFLAREAIASRWKATLTPLRAFQGPNHSFSSVPWHQPTDHR